MFILWNFFWAADPKNRGKFPSICPSVYQSVRQNIQTIVYSIPKPQPPRPLDNLPTPQPPCSRPPAIPQALSPLREPLPPTEGRKFPFCSIRYCPFWVCCPA